MINAYGSPYVTAYDSTYDVFGTLNLTETDPGQSFVEPLTLDEVKTYLKVPLDDPSDDMLLSTMISGAREQAEILQGRDLVRKQWDLSYDYWPEYRVHLRAPTISVDLITYKDLSGVTTTMVEDTNYTVDLHKHPGLITPPWNMSWPAFTPWPSSAIMIRFTSGFTGDSSWWSGAGSRVKMGMMMLITSWYEERLPFVKGAGVVSEYPFAVTSCLSYGRLERVH